MDEIIRSLKASAAFHERNVAYSKIIKASSKKSLTESDVREIQSLQSDFDKLLDPPEFINSTSFPHSKKFK